MMAAKCAPLLLDGLTFDIDFAVTALSRRSSPLGVAAQLAEKRWLAYLPALVPCYTLFLACLCLMKQSVLNRTHTIKLDLYSVFVIVLQIGFKLLSKVI